MKKELKDYLHLYLGCQMKTAQGEIVTLISVTRDGSAFARNSNLHCHGFLSDTKLILRPLSDMVETEALEYARHFGLKGTPPVKVDSFISGVRITIGNQAHGAVLWPVGQYGQKPESLKYLLSRHFDLFGLIPAGIAIDKTTL